MQKIEAHHININKIDVSIIIVNYKSWSHLSACLKSINQINEDELKLETIIVDNNSNDDKSDSFKTNFTQFKFIQNSGNNGFSHGNNLGAFEAEGDYLLFLNPDTIVNKEAVLKMLQLAKNNPDYGIIACKKTTLNGQVEKDVRFFPELATLFGSFRALNAFLNKNKISQKFNIRNGVAFPDWVSGSVFFISKKWFHHIDGWCEDYWLYLEDVDLCKRITKAGGKIALATDAKIIHNHGGASRIDVKTAALTKAEVLISKHVYIQNHFDSKTKYLAHVLLIFNLLFKALLGLIGLIFFFIPSLKVNLLLFFNLVRYYFNALLKRTWISKRAPNYLKGKAI